MRPTAVRRAAAGLVLALAVTAGALTAPAHAATGERATTVPSGARPGTDPAQDALDRIVAAGPPSAAATALRGHHTWTGTAGVADLDTSRPRTVDDRFRAGSITKTLVATVLLQLEAEGRLDLDDRVEKWLPGLIRGNGNNGHRITVRQLLQHTSGLPDYTEDKRFYQRLTTGFPEHRYDSYRPEELVAIALRRKPDFAPGRDWKYSNTGYVVAGMVIEAVTGRPYAREVHRRVLEPLGMTSTLLPGRRTTLPGPAVRHYSKYVGPRPGTAVHDVTEFSPTIAGAAGELVTTSGDLTRFYRALLGGRLLPPAQQRAMFKAVPVPDAPAHRYGLGVVSQRLSCGVTVWGHDGGIHGSASSAAGTRDGRKVLAFNVNGDWSDAPDVGQDLTDVWFCADRPSADRP
ncbi:serine hydrolase domain-containing protein [Streptomyces alkaliterrae]|uniref:Beta-lactamase family protein n=1 Tax=Streptomyces alkaliterrae TaxID=2213162 RepID=A0A5P0YRM5_9ACTN|nr:serine hydrolase domain-containing protein [Streptomyces alkaliterrae]MBB1254599.1 beta-lactamase family protein [Streptomyces alkaliterrae]MBB1261963.1 beta-lactamase family protein [Streptomyces alkaliterrae]MQS02966.1 serine hydrolase [Streptomyces alkaliterrae]